MKTCRRIAIIFLSLFCLAGCGKEPETIEEAAPTPAADWKINGFAVSETVEEEQQLWIEEYIPWQHEGLTYDVETEKISRVMEPGICGEKLYRLHVVTEPSQGTVTRCILETYDASVMKTAYTELSLKQLGMEGMESGLLVDMDVCKEQFVFQVVEYESSAAGKLEQTANSMIYTDLGQNLQRVDLLSAYKEKGIVESDYEFVVMQGECICDAAGNSYVRSVDGEYPYRSIYIFDKAGMLVMEHTFGEQETISEPLRTEEGELIFPVYNQQNQSTQMVWFDIENNKAKTIAVLKDTWIQQLYGMQGNMVYYEDWDGIVKWDIITGDRTLILRLKENGVGTYYDTMLMLREGKAPILRLYGRVNEEWEDWLVLLSEEEVEPENPIQIVSVTESTDRVRQSVAIAGRKNPNYNYVFEEVTASDREDYRTQVMAELAAGKGPDVLYVSLEDMEILQKQGLLLSLEGLLSEETLNRVLPGVVELGSRDDMLVGMPSEIAVTTMMISESVGAGESWTLEEAIAFMESGALNGRLVHAEMFFAPRAALSTLLSWNLADCFLIDWENRESHFEDERFLKLLEYTKVDMSGGIEVQGNSLGEQEDQMILTALSSKTGLGQFAGTRIAENSYFIGLPTEQECGSFLECEGMLVVNKNTTNPEAVSVYLECLLGEEVQAIGDELPVLKLSTEDIVYGEEGNGAYWNEPGSKNGYDLLVFEDGTTSLHEAKALLEACVPMPKTYEALQNIIMEEVQAYYAGEKSAEEVAEIIDNRVQLYLDEGNQ